MIAEQTIEAIRQRVSITQVVGERVKLEKRGRSHLGLCPFHKEKTPSFHVNAEKGFFYCFGCQAKGNVIGFVQQVDGLTFPEAVRSLAERVGLEVDESSSPEEQLQQAEGRRRRQELYEVGRVAGEYFRRCLQEHPLGHLAREELARRGLWPPKGAAMESALAEFCVGYAPYGWDGLSGHLQAARLSLRSAQEVGLVVPRRSGEGHYDRFRHRLMFAVLDLQGRVVAFSGRRLEDPAPEELSRLRLSPRPPGDPPAKYVNSPESSIYRKREVLFGLYQARAALRESDSCVVVEGNFDVVSLHARGLGHVVAPLGTAFTPDQASQIKRFTQRVVFLFDGDAAGARATRAARAPCQHEGLSARVARLPSGQDPDDLVREAGPDAIRRLLAGAQPILEYLIDTALGAGVGTHDARATAEKIQEVAQIIASEEDSTVRLMAERYADGVAGSLGIADVRSFRALQAKVREAALGRKPAPSMAGLPPERARSHAKADAVEQAVLGALVEYPELQDHAAVQDALQEAEGELALALLCLRRQAGRPQEDAAGFAERFPPALRGGVAARLAAPELPDQETALVVLQSNLAKLQRKQAKRALDEVVMQLKRAEQSGDLEALSRLLAQQQQRARALRGLR